MYARIGRARIKPGARAEVEALCAKIGANRATLAGVRCWMNFITETDELIVIAVYETAEHRARAAVRNISSWRSGQHLLAEAPTFTYAEMTQFVAADLRALTGGGTPPEIVGDR
jgi:hypothetical protein